MRPATLSLCTAIAGGTTMPALPTILLTIARRLVRGADADAEDLVGDFLLRLVEATQRGTAGSAARLLHLTEPELQAVVRHRMRQLLAERSPHRRLVKQLRDAVRRARRVGLPPAPESPPTTLLAHDRLSSLAVGEAAAWVLAQSDAPAGTDVAGIVDRLRNVYFGAEATESDAVDAGDDLGLDAARLAQRLRAGLTPEHLQVLRGRLRDHDLASLAAGANVALSTIHGRLAKAVEAARRISRDVGAGPEVGKAALRLLAA